MTSQHDTRAQVTGRIVLFPTPTSLGKGKSRRDVDQTDVHKAEIGDLRKYERGTEPDDYRRRMIINAAAFAFIVVLTLAGVWLAEQFALLQRNQDCVFSGRKNCTDIDALIR
jgi:hypothetical protein